MASLKKEVWLRGPLPAIPALLQPVAHALMQAEEEVSALMQQFPDTLLWKRPAGVASAGFHLKHLSGVLDRMFTYAAGLPLTDAQFKYLAAEQLENTGDVKTLIERFAEAIDASLKKLAQIDEGTLKETRLVGRAQIPSTLIGLLVHAAEHTQRHVGQLLVTVRILADQAIDHPH